MLRLFFVRARATPYLFLSKNTHWLSLIQNSMLLNIDMNMILPLKSRGSVDPKNVWIYLMIWIVGWPENMSMELHWSARDTTHVHECRRVPYFREFCRPCLVCNGVVMSHTHNTRSQETCSYDLDRFRIGGSKRDKLFQESVWQFCRNVISWNSAATFVRSWSLTCTVSMIVCFLWIWWFMRIILIFHLLQSNETRLSYNRSWTRSENSLIHEKIVHLVDFPYFEHMFGMMWSFKSSVRPLGSQD